MRLGVYTLFCVPTMLLEIQNIAHNTYKLCHISVTVSLSSHVQFSSSSHFCLRCCHVQQAFKRTARHAYCLIVLADVNCFCFNTLIHKCAQNQGNRHRFWVGRGESSAVRPPTPKYPKNRKDTGSGPLHSRIWWVRPSRISKVVGTVRVPTATFPRKRRPCPEQM